jgi:hypothetical protein
MPATRAAQGSRRFPREVGSGKASRGFKPSTQDALVAVWSLYADELRPCGRTLRRRVGEIEAAKRQLTEAVDVDVASLRRCCEESPLVRVFQESGGDWCALLQGVEERFVDVHSSEDPFGDAIWCLAEEHFRQHQEALPGSRYACARALAAQGLPFLAQLSLGRICHFTQLAISQKKLLGHQQGALVPYQLSKAMLKDQHAQQQRPCENPEICESTFASIHAVRSTLLELLSSGPLPLSSIKRLFRSHAGLELSETALGFSKLCELLQSEHFNDICEVRLAAHSYVVHARFTRPRISLAERIEIDAVPCSATPTSATLDGCGKRQRSRSSGGSTRAESEESSRRAPVFALEPLDFDCLEAENEREDKLGALRCSPLSTPMYIPHTPAGARWVPPTPSPWSPIATPVRSRPVPPTPCPFGDGSSW